MQPQAAKGFFKSFAVTTQQDSASRRKLAKRNPFYCFKAPIGTTKMPFLSLYAKDPVPVNTILNEGDFILSVSIFSESFVKVLIPSAIRFSETVN